MGFNTIAVFLNDQTEDWPRGMVEAMNSVSYDEGHGFFGTGQVLSCAHADEVQLVAVSRNTGQRLSHFEAIDQRNLDAMAEVMRAHGYTVKAPGQSRGKGPLTWGFAADQAKQAAAAKDAKSEEQPQEG
jgi:hypothetical protein